MSLRIQTGVTIVAALFIVAGCNLGQEEESLSINIGGYDYDRTRAIIDGHVSIAEAEVKFEVSNIYEMNRLAFGMHSIQNLD